MDTQLIGVDFSSRPTARKPVVVALGDAHAGRVRLQAWERFHTLEAFGAWLRHTPRWIGGFDLPFGLPRELVAALGWPLDWGPCMDLYAGLTRARIRDTFAAFCAARPVGAKFAHRACDRPAGSSPSMKWVNPPVAYMLHAGVPLLRAAQAHFPAHFPAHLPAHLPAQEPAQPNAARVALEAYPGLLAREIVGHRSYKSDDVARQTDERLLARLAIADALIEGRTRLAMTVELDSAQQTTLVDDASGDTLDAVLCLVQAAWAAGQPRWGLPAHVDPLEGWIVSA